MHTNVSSVPRTGRPKGASILNAYARISRMSALGLVTLALTLALTGCAEPASASLLGTWMSPYGDSLTVTTERFVYGFGDEITFAGTIENAPDFWADSGYIIVQVTEAGSYGPAVDSYYAVRWESLSSRGVREASAYKEGSLYNSGMPTKAEAEAEYTKERGYFGMFGEYERAD